MKTPIEVPPAAWSDSVSRRKFLHVSAATAAFGAAYFTTPGLFAEELVVTPSSRGLEGPFYPDKLPLDTDNDLLIINDGITPAVGEVAHVHGTVKTKTGAPLRNAWVEIWQCDMNESYLHSRGRNPDKKPDPNFQGYGRFLTDFKGQYYFRTIKPVAYTVNNIFRTPHIHFAVSKNGRRIFTSQMLIKGHADNARDGLTRQIRASDARESIMADFKKLPGSKIGELVAQWDIVLGRTLEEVEDGTKWGLGRR